MAQRMVCIYKDQTIGIESIYTIREGKKINIPGKVEELRKLGRQNQLFCPCGCGANLILVAGDRNLREQHFRIKEGTGKGKCIALEETDISINSKIMLKGWLDLKLPSARIGSRVQLKEISDSERKFEFTFFDYTNRIGVCYWYERANIESDKVNMFEDFNGVNKTLYVTDIHNAGSTGQYPEFMIKIQNKQGYVLYLDLKDSMFSENGYEKVTLDTRVFVQNRYQTWQEMLVISDKLDAYSVSADGDLIHNNLAVKDVVREAIEKFQSEENEKLQIEQAKREELLAKTKAKDEVSVPTKVTVKPQKTREEIQREIEEEYKKRRGFTEDGQEISLLDFANCDKVIRDRNGERWVQCKVCGKKSLTKDFVSYGGKDTLNLGVCYTCHKDGKDNVEMPVISDKENKKARELVCPECGGKLVEKRGRFGTFMGCQNYPECRFTINTPRK